MNMIMENLRNDNDKIKPNYLKENPFQCRFVPHKFHRDRPGVQQKSPW
jgi:hypothetical protein